MYVKYHGVREERQMDGPITIEKVDGVNVARFCFNEIALDQRNQIKEALGSLVDRGEKDFVIDLSKVGFLSSLVIAIIVFFAKEVRKREGQIKISGLSDEAAGIFEITQLDRILDVYDTERDAIKSFKKI
jgi:anti-sigma B factor antagonist